MTGTTNKVASVFIKACTQLMLECLHVSTEGD